MQSKNSKSESYIVREAESIIEKYISNREYSDIKRYHKLKEKYEKLKVLNIAILVTLASAIMLSIFF